MELIILGYNLGESVFFLVELLRLILVIVVNVFLFLVEDLLFVFGVSVIFVEYFLGILKVIISFINMVIL